MNTLTSFSNEIEAATTNEEFFGIVVKLKKELSDDSWLHYNDNVEYDKIASKRYHDLIAMVEADNDKLSSFKGGLYMLSIAKWVAVLLSLAIGLLSTIAFDRFGGIAITNIENAVYGVLGSIVLWTTLSIGIGISRTLLAILESKNN